MEKNEKRKTKSVDFTVVKVGRGGAPAYAALGGQTLLLISQREDLSLSICIKMV